MDLRAQGRIKCGVFHADAWCLCTLCPRALRHELLARPSLVRSGSDVETDDGNRSIRSAAFGLLAARQNHTCRVFKSSGGKGSSVCALRLFIGSDIIYTIPKHQDHVPVAITVA